ncbi:DUF2802 domain-containing protein [Thalassotalea castellviae]|uniref:DUF2802 domain-containing protein n=1 Tax=Thalassotalea castellviae TaxID=3075612 RepID=A0ABU2ZYW8_9GAMM|nr:DUF2802 domain-containing protein [Thalassotalea sp. W431]MDT0602823.1 DUF2802 domain-containing protein [Thalassotalea sp. W431]
MDVLMVYSLAALALVLFLFVLIFFQNKKNQIRFSALEVQIESYEFIINELKLANQQQQSELTAKENSLQAWQLEHRQISQQLEHRIKVLQEKLTQTHETIEQIQQQQPEDKLYSRAQKMVKLGADVEELVRECDLPHAEAEILIAMHKQKNT